MPQYTLRVTDEARKRISFNDLSNRLNRIEGLQVNRDGGNFKVTYAGSVGDLRGLIRYSSDEVEIVLPSANSIRPAALV